MDAMEVDAPATKKVELSLNVLALTSETRNMHGLRHQDYQRYRQFCTSKVQHLRKVTSHTQSAPRRKFEKKEVTSESASSEKHLQILLFMAERNWAYSMELRQEVRDEPRKRPHLVKRLKRAVQTAQQLQKVCNVCGDARTMFDVKAYTAQMTGYLLFEQQKWEAAWDQMAVARTIYVQLSKSGTAQQATMCQSAVDDIDPNIRYCAYNLKVAGAQNTSVDALVQGRDQKAQLGLPSLADKVKSTLVHVSSEADVEGVSLAWGGKSIPVRNPAVTKILADADAEWPALRFISTAIRDIEELEGELEMHETTLKKVNEAVSIAKAAVKEDEIAVAKVKSSKSDQNTANLQLVLAFALFQRLAVVLARNQVSMEILKAKIGTQSPTISRKKQSRPQDVLDMCDRSSQYVEELKALPILEVDLGLQTFLTAVGHLLKAQKTLYLARTFASTTQRAESLVLCDRALEHVAHARMQAEAASRLETSRDLAVNTLKQDIAATDSSVRAAKVQEQARWFLEQAKSVDAVATGVAEMGLEDVPKPSELPLASRLDTYVASFDEENPNLVAFPPTLQPAPYKPLFFDMAYHGIDFPNRNVERRIASQERKPRAESGQVEAGSKSGGGLLGVFGGLWGGKK
ncbi:hypothetical protein DFJ77DRAFT_124444 [Powellomyces hirtus]|nr:hypothetical protein DFJ77DRAFT_124444 [Powellomyces hirtus]